MLTLNLIDMDDLVHPGICVIFAVSFGGAYDTEDINNSPCIRLPSTTHAVEVPGLAVLCKMDIGNIFEKLEDDSKNLIITAAFCFPMAYLDCWKISPHFSEIELIPQIILAIGIAIILAIAGTICNLIYLALSGNIAERLYPFISIIPSYVASIVVVLSNRKITPLSFEFSFVGFSLLIFAHTLFTRIVKHRHERKRSENCENDADNA